MRLRFAKYEGLGNDFLVVESHDVPASRLDAEAAIALCDRHFGVGGDGVLLVGRAPYSMRVVNADGSIAEMCGNGLRCVALHLARTGAGPSFVVETDAGPHLCEVELSDEGRAGQVRVEMRVPSLVPAEVPIRADSDVFVERPVEVGAHRVLGTAVSMGNPHFVVFDAGAPREELGPLLAKSEAFPEGVNVGFAQLRDGGIDLAVHERGAGWTLACGTGACASVVAAVETGRVARHEDIEVRLPGGALRIRVGERGERVQMRGPARLVFDGELDLSRFPAA